jgi:hypothetical protein
MRISRKPSPVQIMIDQNGECGIFHRFVWHDNNDKDVHAKVNPGLPRQKHHLTGRRLLLKANWT